MRALKVRVLKEKTNKPCAIIRGLERWHSLTRKQEVEDTGFLLVNSLQKLSANGRRPESTKTTR